MNKPTCVFDFDLKSKTGEHNDEHRTPGGVHEAATHGPVVAAAMPQLIYLVKACTDAALAGLLIA